MASLDFSKLFAPNQVNNANETLYTVPASPTTNRLRNAVIRFANTTAGAVTIKAFAVPSGGAAGDDNVFLPTTSVAANSYIDVDMPVLEAGGTLVAIAGAATSITAHYMSGVLESV